MKLTKRGTVRLYGNTGYKAQRLPYTPSRG